MRKKEEKEKKKKRKKKKERKIKNTHVGALDQGEDNWNRGVREKPREINKIK